MRNTSCFYSCSGNCGHAFHQEFHTDGNTLAHLNKAQANKTIPVLCFGLLSVTVGLAMSDDDPTLNTDLSFSSPQPSSPY